MMVGAGPSKAIARLSLSAAVIAFVVVVLGAYVRLSDAGLGCPDWPGCYGRLGAPQGEAAVAEANADYPERPVETGKAWREMVHRYLAGILGLMIVAIAGLAWRRRGGAGAGAGIPLVLVVLVVLQALLGMWTVTLVLQPLVVVTHLVGGFTILALLVWLTLRESALRSVAAKRAGRARGLRPWVVAAFFVLGAQVVLGGWVSANYAGLACPDFPTCHDSWWPESDFREGFTLWREVATDFEGGVLAGRARIAVQLAHRVGALITFLYIGGLGIAVLVSGAGSGLGTAAWWLLGALAGQISIGIGNVIWGLPLPLAVAHNAVGAALLLALTFLAHRLWPVRGHLDGN